LKSFKDYYYGYESVDGKPMPGYMEMIENLNELLEKGNITLSDYNKFIEMEGLNFSYEKEGEL